MKWLPIETAPKDQTEVILFAPNENPSVFTGMFIYGWVYSVAGRYSPEDDYYGDAPIYATKWMPLPPPPKGE